MIMHDHSDDQVHFLQIHLGGDRNFCYLLGDRRSGAAAAVDPGFAPEQLLATARERELQLRYILVTHGHIDHVGGADRLAELSGAAIHAHEDARLARAVPVADGQELGLGKQTIRALYTPGHAPGHLCYLFAGRLLTGDLLFCGKVGGTGPFFTGSSARQEWESLHRVLQLPAETLVFPGHDYYGGEGSRTHSTIAHEREHNPFLLCRDLAAFQDLKDSWPEYKREHGIR
jgi:hydroxyacylglutathione hydrolase